MRIMSGVPLRNGGWLHLPDQRNGALVRPTTPINREPCRIRGTNWAAMHRAWVDRTSDIRLSVLADQLGVTTQSLRETGCCWGADSHGRPCWVWPMYDGQGHVCGFRCRASDGAKYAYEGSRQGVFLPATFAAFPVRVYLVEGPTDLCAALMLGFCAIGRPSCRGNETTILQTLKRLPVRDVVIVADSDAPGIDGAMALQKRLPYRSVVWVPALKDLRDVVRTMTSRGHNIDAIKKLIDSDIRNLQWKGKTT